MSQLYVIENDELRLTVSTHGAEAVSVIDKASGAEMLWQADSKIWARHAPILFPYTGKLVDGKTIIKGVEYQGRQHGFARDVTHTLVHKGGNMLVFELTADTQTLPLWPYGFVLRSTFLLEGKTLHHTLTVENPSEPMLRFGIGFHPAFAFPFDEWHKTTDYLLRFDEVESPLCLSTQPGGYLNGQWYFLANNTRTLPMTDTLFDADSHCMVNLRSKHLSLVEKDTGRSISVEIAGFPYVLIWSAPTKPLRFVCLEPWQSPTAEVGGSPYWEERPCAASLAKGESFSTTLSTTFDR